MVQLSPGSKGGMKVGGLKDSKYVLYHIDAYLVLALLKFARVGMVILKLQSQPHSQIKTSIME